MTRWAPCKRREFVRKLRALGFTGPRAGSRHEFMIWQEHRLTIPSNDEFSVPQLRFMLREVEAIIGRAVSDEWHQL